MTDRELLELAAKVAGVFLTAERFATESSSAWTTDMNPFYDDRKGFMTGYRTWYGSEGDIGGWESFNWNPLTDDGDALRLAVTLGLVVDCSRPSAALPYVRHAVAQGDYTDQHAATRRAIVRAAAEIGKAA